MFPCRHFSSAGKPKLNTCVSILYVSVDVNIESEVIFPKPWRNINNKLGFFFMCFITLLMTRTQSTFFCNWTNPSLCNDWPFCPSSYSETERAIWSLHVLALVMWHHVPLYCDVVSRGEEMKCLEAMWETCVCVSTSMHMVGLQKKKWASTSLSDPVHVSACGPGINLALRVLILELIHS